MGVRRVRERGRPQTTGGGGVPAQLGGRLLPSEKGAGRRWELEKSLSDNVHFSR